MREQHLARARKTVANLMVRADKAGVGKPLREFLAPMLNLSPYTQVAYTQVFVQLAERFGWPFSKISASEIAGWVNEVQGSTRGHRLRVAKMILRWVYDDELPKEIRRLKIRGIQAKHKIDEESLLTSEEIRRVRDAFYTLRDKALFMTLVGSGLRIGEILSMNVKDVVDKQGTFRLRVHGKVGEYEAFIKTECVPWLKRWLLTFNTHDGDQPLWPSVRDPNVTISPQAFYWSMRKACKRAGLKKRVHPHLFRHQRNTELLRQLGADKANIIQHYAKGSNILQRTYGHLTEQDRVNAFYEAEGLEPTEPVKPEPIDEPAAPIICPRCQLENSPQFRFCGGCAQPLVEEALGDIAEAEDLVDRILELLLQNPDLMAELKKRGKD